ncbi:RTA1 like protein-domain-containing protein [Coprinopsis sp. MPI-PUGE-AT-0042]|nr:RTA1 like protein-domain-containing protein [Coprinopsis sp. MPI-PUGE-AT-0042]
MAEGARRTRYVFYHYIISVPAAATFVALFALSTLYHCYQLFKTRRWTMVPLIIGGLMSIGGYAARIVSHEDQWKLGPYVGQTLLLLVAPVLFAATIYMTLAGIIITSVAQNIANARSAQPTAMQTDSVPSSYSSINEKGTTTPRILASDVEAAKRTKVFKIPVVWITRTFVTADVIALVTQGGGGGIMAGGNITRVHIGEKVVLGGLLFQIVAFSFFLIISISFDRRQRKEQALSGRPAKKGWRNIEGWRKMLYALYAGSTLLLVRNTFRVIEYAQGNDGYLLRNEIWLYLFDAVLMFALMAILNVIHPGEVLVGDGYRQAATQEAGEIEMGHNQQ